ncbi:MAG: hypothetical protein ACE5NA_00150 [Nitrospiraceae bacterium]
MTVGETLVLYLGDRRIPAEQFMEAVEAFLDVTQEVTREITGKPNRIRWLVSVEKGSAVLRWHSQPEAPRVPVAEVTEAVESGFKLLAFKQKKGKRVARPSHFNDEALRSARKIARLVPKGREIQVRRSRRRARVTATTVANINAIIEAQPVEIGSVEGRLLMMSLRGTPHFGVWDVLTDRQIECRLKARGCDFKLGHYRIPTYPLSLRRGVVYSEAGTSAQWSFHPWRTSSHLAGEAHGEKDHEEGGREKDHQEGGHRSRYGSSARYVYRKDAQRRT